MTSSLFVILWFVAGLENLIYNNKGQQFLEEISLISCFGILLFSITKITAVTTDFTTTPYLSTCFNARTNTCPLQGPRPGFWRKTPLAKVPGQWLQALNIGYWVARKLGFTL